MLQSQDIVPHFTAVLVQPLEPNSAELVTESDEPLPLVPPHATDSEVLNLSTSQPLIKSPDEVPYNY